MKRFFRRRAAPVEAYVVPTLPNGHRPEYANCHGPAFRAARAAAEGRELDETFFKRLAQLSFEYGEKP